MSVLAWWLIPIALTLGAIVWATLRGRPRKSADTRVSVAQAERMRRALAKPLPRHDRTSG